MTLSIKASNFCCGLWEIGNFAYTADNARGMPHYHRPSGAGSDYVVTADKPTTKQAILKKLGEAKSYGAGAVYASTGEDQEYLIPILTDIGFQQHTFTNSMHTRIKDGVNFWFLSLEDVSEL